ncbi:MAG: type II toxin-antitoxin system RelE/ParE family toxin [Actinobacteria bacterium]|nr:type II toxin-antitoxin system RelE/ParE family toxin [Actinomycetota bacterium]
MAREVVWSAEAVADIEALANYIARDSAAYATSFVQEILDSSKTLSSFSKRGRIVPELDDSSVRELLIRDYRIIYHVEKSRIIILGLIHGSRDLNKPWKSK